MGEMFIAKVLPTASAARHKSEAEEVSRCLDNLHERTFLAGVGQVANVRSCLRFRHPMAGL